jgi:hypothetical protein
MKKRGGEEELGEEREKGREKERVFVFFCFFRFSPAANQKLSSIKT